MIQTFVSQAHCFVQVVETHPEKCIISYTQIRIPNLIGMCLLGGL